MCQRQDESRVRAGPVGALGNDYGEQLQGQVRVYHATTESRELRVEIVDQSCIDAATGDNLPSRVMVMIDGVGLHGCGRYLGYPW